MLLAKHFVFIHVAKTGGTTVRLLLEEHAPPEWELTDFGEHPTYADVPASHAALPKLAFVRNPYSWYVSWFYFEKSRARSEAFLNYSEGDTLCFADTMRKMLHSRPELEFGAGPFLQFLMEALGPGFEGVTTGRMEHMREDLPRMLGACCEIPAPMAEAIAAMKPLNTSPHEHYSTYYDDELREIIYEKDKPIFEHYGYEFESPTS